ncbi:MAG: hypothetical protein ACR2RF_32595 [Geminicoccaceae bacterium]
MLILFRLASENVKLMAAKLEIADWLDRFNARSSAELHQMPN